MPISGAEPPRSRHTALDWPATEHAGRARGPSDRLG